MPRLAINKTVMFLMASVVLAALAALVFRQHLKSQEDALQERFAKRGQEVSVAVPRKPMLAGTVVTIADFASRRVPVDLVPEDAVVPEEFERAEGQTLRVALDAGRPLMWSFLLSGKAPAFSDSLKNGRRAVTITVDEINSVSGMLRPGDRIDLLRLAKQAGTGESQKTVAPLLQNVLVRATGTVTRRETDRQTGEAVDRQYSTVTLDLDPKDVGRVVLAQDMNALRAVLRGVNESAIAQFGVTSESDIRMTADASGAMRARTIDFYLGGQGGPVQPIAVPVDDATSDAPKFAVADQREMREIAARRSGPTAPAPAARDAAPATPPSPSEVKFTLEPPKRGSARR